ncbi:MAG: HAMP domain-containing histidine kinase [Cytophagaceae bacterium]|jgi:signal transduction histidine kinase|nr:HAMP domain-containing histidine kinase [Cytophagaceae bacterium]
MKLIYKAARFYLVFALFIFGLGTVVFYYVIRVVLLDSIDEAIHQEKLQLIDNLKYEVIIEELKPSENIIIKKTSAPSGNMQDQYATIRGMAEDKQIDYRELTSIYEHQGQYYEIKIKQSLEEAESLLNAILPAQIGLFLIFLVGVLLVNNFVNRYTWQPFYDILEKIKWYDFEKTKVIPYQHNDITEFNELSESIEKMTEKIYRDYLSQKEFNENSSHELQTPLAILKNKLELLIQSPHLKAEEMELIGAMFETIKRLSNLNKGLILLSKIENRQFSETSTIQLAPLLEDILEIHSDNLKEKEITLLADLDKDVRIFSNPVLIEILFSNLVSNAIKHNIPGGKLSVQLHASEFVITNTGNPLQKPAELMFGRFQKSGQHAESIGLGLAIVKKICSMEEFHIQYQNKETLHEIRIQFSNHP